MTFLNPLVLFGLLASSIPLLLHLINLRKQKNIEFSTLRFLNELKRTEIKKLKLKQIILLILRILIITFIVLAFSRPTINSTIPGFDSYSKSSTVILLDNSSSMDLSDEFGNRFTQAKRAVGNIISELKEGDEVVVIELAGNENINKYQLSSNFEQVKDDIQKIKLSNEAAIIDNGLHIAENILEKSKNINKNIYVVSDLQKNVFINQDSSFKLDNRIGVIVVQAGKKSAKDINNTGIDSIDLKTKIFQIGKLVEIEATIKNYSDKEIKSSVVNMYFNGQNVAQRSFDLAPKAVTKITVSAPVSQKGSIKGTLELETDGFELDNKKYFGFAIPDAPNVAIVANQSTQNLFKIITEVEDIQSTINATYFNSNQLGSINFDSYDLIVIASSDVSTNEGARLKSYVNNGGNAFIFGDFDNIQALTNFTSALGIGEIKQQNFPKEAGKFSKVEKLHPIFDGVFTGNTDKNQIVETPEIKQALTLQSGNKIIELGNQGLLNEYKIGFGKLFYFGLSPDDKYSNLPFTGIFPTLFYRSMIYLATADNFNQNKSKENNILNLIKKNMLDGNIKIIGPKNIQYFAKATTLATTAYLDISPYKEPGTYTVFNSADKIIGIFSVNINKSESEIADINQSDIEKEFEKRITNKSFIHYIDDIADVKSGIQRARVGTEIWQIFLILAIICAITEMLVAKNSKSEFEA